MKSSIEDGKITINFDIDDIDEELISFLSYYETLKKSKASENDIQKLSDEIKSGWWKKNKDRIMNEESNS